MSATLELLSYEDSGSQQSMTLVGNLVLCGSKSVYYPCLHHMTEYLEWLLIMMRQDTRRVRSTGKSTMGVYPTRNCVPIL
ncbi:hypothetical protein DSO57_1014420 [Entomophthora muscae]|uniref:Uncharacterized protein n=1 Tax=Entomophthora muscae TaxID=34485 RepID=A0ACC2UQY6_9FUNG|nr:hypothetical protein DSO57_1014420 [Entomophthora muscae]